MAKWKPKTKRWVANRLNSEMESLPVSHRRILSEFLVKPYRVPVHNAPGDSVVVVAEIESEALYYSDVELGWELEALVDGGIPSRGCNQFDLSHITHQRFGGT